MPALFALVFLLASATTPTVFEDLTVAPAEEGALIRVGIRGAPSFTTSEEPGLFLVDFSRVEGSPQVRGETQAPGVRRVEALPRPDGLRLRIELEQWAQAEPRLEEGALVIRVFRRPDAPASADPAEMMATAMQGLADQVARLGQELRGLTGSPEESAAPAPAGEAVAAAEPEPKPEASKPKPAPVAAVARAASGITAELVRLGFRPTPGGALVVVALEGEGEHRWEQRDNVVILELPGTRIRRANDRRVLDASWFQTPVGLIRPVEDRAARTTRIEIKLQKPADVSVQRSGNEITVALAELSAGAR
mgnify:CR=1 FL=1